MTNCWFCGSKMICNSDADFKEAGMKGEGTIVFLSCTNDECDASAEFFTKINE